jgi:hypothetical protein
MSIEAITGSIIESVTAEPAEASQDAGIEVSGEINPTQGDSDLAQRLAILAKKEKGLLSKQQEMAAKLKEMEEKSKKFSEWEEIDKLASENPTEYFKKKGLSFEQIQQKMLESMQDDDLDPIQKQLKELQSKLANKDSEIEKLLNDKLSERDNQKKQQEIEEQSKYYNQELKKFIGDKSEQYDLINTFEASEEVFNVIKTVYLKTAEKGSPKLMSFDEACDLYEKKLEELVQGMKKSKKVSKIFGVDDSEDIFGKVSGQVTLDDSFSPSSAHSPELKTEAERLRAAAKLFEQQLKA